MRDLQITRDTGIGACMDICASDGYLLAIQNSGQFNSGRIVKLDTYGNFICDYTGIGCARQIAIKNNTAVVSAREDGLWIFDVSGDKIICKAHYCTVEYATGVTLYSDFALVSCRQYGVEIIDISDSSRPYHIGLIRIGEVQSTCVYEGYLYGGVWGEMCVAVVDIRDITSPKIIVRIPLSGRGDGVCVKDGILYAATGQHGRGIVNVSDENDPMYGMGNGFEAFDITDLHYVRLLHRDFIGKRYYIHFDSWRTYISGNRLILCSSSFGAYVYDMETFELITHFCVSDGDAITGAAVSDGNLWLSSGRGGLYICDAGKLDAIYRYDIRENIKTAPMRFSADSDALTCVYSAQGYQVLDICAAGQYYALACASGGIVLTDADFNEIDRRKTEGFCYDVKYGGGCLFAANGNGGFCIYSIENGSLYDLSSTCLGASVLQCMISDDGRYAVCGIGSTQVALLDCSAKSSPKKVCTRQARKGPLYGANFASHTLSDGTMLMFWHRDGLICINPSAGEMVFRDYFYDRQNGFMGFGPENGCDTDGERVYYNLDGGYIFLPLDQNVCTDDLKRYTPENPIRGKFTLCGSLLISAERSMGIVGVTDISIPEHPKTVRCIHTTGSVAKPVYANKRILIPAGNCGLLELKT